jgi:hypothetical protein
LEERDRDGAVFERERVEMGCLNRLCFFPKRLIHVFDVHEDKISELWYGKMERGRAIQRDEVE